VKDLVGHTPVSEANEVGLAAFGARLPHGDEQGS
jgi:hypothetical protein